MNRLKGFTSIDGICRHKNDGKSSSKKYCELMPPSRVRSSSSLYPVVVVEVDELPVPAVSAPEVIPVEPVFGGLVVLVFVWVLVWVEWESGGCTTTVGGVE